MLDAGDTSDILNIKGPALSLDLYHSLIISKLEIFLQVGKMMSVMKAASSRRAEKALKEILDKARLMSRVVWGGNFYLVMVAD